MITNFEKYVEEIKEEIEDYNFFCVVASIKDKNNLCNDDCSACRMSCLDWLKEEYKEPIKLTKWEYDLILNCAKIYRYNDKDILENSLIIIDMKRKGYFKGLNDLNITLEEIKNNHIIVEDNYDFDKKHKQGDKICQNL